MLSRLYAALALFVFGAIAGYALYQHVEGIGYARGVAETKEAVRVVGEAADAANRLVERKQTDNLLRALENEKERAKTLLADRDSLHVERDRLREQTINYASGGDVPSASADACPQRVATISELFNQCAARYEEVAQHADGHASDSLTLQEAWAR